jgi:hypothetical protein
VPFAFYCNSYFSTTDQTITFYFPISNFYFPIYNRTCKIPFYFNDLLKLIKTLPIQDKVKIEKEMEKETLIYRAKQLSQRIKENPFDTDSIVAEVSEYRTLN